MVVEIDDDVQDNQYYRFLKLNLFFFLYIFVNNNERILFFNLCEISCRVVTYYSDKL